MLWGTNRLIASSTSPLSQFLSLFRSACLARSKAKRSSIAKDTDIEIKMRRGARDETRRDEREEKRRERGGERYEQRGMAKSPDQSERHQETGTCRARRQFPR
eukprot:762875-Hanusia_phi.AAC.3